MNRGIDYGMGLSNIDHTTGIRYGVIPMGRLHEWAWDEMESIYPDPTCEDCEVELTSGNSQDYSCPSCKREYWSYEFDYSEPLGHRHEQSGYLIEVDSHGDAFVLKSPWKVRAAFCSPCAPGACYLTDPVEDGDWAYCLGPEWFDEDSPMPYTPVKVQEENL